jgi:hypothetical protein
MELKQSDEAVQRLYARWLDAGAKTAFIIALGAFALYVGRVLAPFVPLEALPRLWGLPVGEFLRRTGAPSGWSWLPLFDRADYLNLACLALLACVSLVCYLRLLLAFVRRGDRLETAIAAAQVLVLAAAASGLFAAAH